MSSKSKLEFLDSIPAAKLRDYKKCLEARGRPSKECKPIRDEFNKFVKANKSAPRATKAKAKPAPKAKPMTVAEKCKKTPIAKCEKPCKVFKTPNGEYCRKPKPTPKSPTKQTKKALSMMA